MSFAESFAKILLARLRGLLRLVLRAPVSDASPLLHQVGNDNRLTLKSGSTHAKTKPRRARFSRHHHTLTLSGSLPSLKANTLLCAHTWQNTKACLRAKRELLKLPTKDKFAKISVGTSTGPTRACPDSTFTFHDPAYDLTDEQAPKDSFYSALITLKHPVYHYTAHIHTNLSLQHDLDWSTEQQRGH